MKPVQRLKGFLTFAPDKIKKAATIKLEKAYIPRNVGRSGFAMSGYAEEWLYVTKKELMTALNLIAEFKPEKEDWLEIKKVCLHFIHEQSHLLEKTGTEMWGEHSFKLVKNKISEVKSEVINQIETHIDINILKTNEQQMEQGKRSDSKPIQIHEITEFSEVEKISNCSIHSVIINNVRNLREDEQIEQYIRQIIFDPNKTPHGPTEIADILSFVTINNKKKYTAFVLKGKSFKTVTAKEVSHQFLKLRQLSGLSLIIFGAVGNIQDDALRDFVTTATDIGCEYLVIDAQDFARLFIAYEKICPKDGTPYNELGMCELGHVISAQSSAKPDTPEVLEIPAAPQINEDLEYTIERFEDISHNAAKRYSAILIVDKHYSVEQIKEIINSATEELKHRKYYRNEHTRARWGNSLAHVVWLYIAFDTEDVASFNWVCRSLWIEDALSVDMRPAKLYAKDIYNGIEILWNESYKERKKMFKQHQGTKEEVLEANQLILKNIVPLAEEAIINYNKWKDNIMHENEFLQIMNELWPLVDELYTKSTDLPMAPAECKELDNSYSALFGTIHDMFLYYSPRGMQTWNEQNRKFLMESTIKRFEEDFRQLLFEQKKCR